MAQIGELQGIVPLDFDAVLKAHMKALGSKGGKVSGAKRMQMPKKKRVAIARRAAAARWKGKHQS